METKHTPEPWAVEKATHSHEFGTDFIECILVNSARQEIARTSTRIVCNDSTPNAERIVACVNACAGLNPEAIQELIAALDAVTQQLSDLHAAICDQELEDHFVDDSINMLSEGGTAIEQARAALAKAKGEADVS
jgi:hypothetical protein